MERPDLPPPPTKDPAEELITAALLLADHLTIVHQVPGRVRLKISAAGIEKAMAARLEFGCQGIRGVLSHSIHPISRSIVVEYDPEVLGDGLWGRLLELRRRPELAIQLLKELRSLLLPSAAAG